MIQLGTELDDMDFDALIELARSRLPALAKEWTDYNFHDPGITLIDLLAWIADSQIYSLARNRRDERIAMAGLLGIRPRGAVSATGELYPAEPPLAHRPIDADTRLTPIHASAPRLEVAHSVDLLPIAIEAVVSEGPSGSIDHTAANEHPRASYAPFGTPSDPCAALRIQLKGALPNADVRLSLGFTVEGDDAPDARLGRIAVFYRDAGGQEHPIAPDPDASAALQTNGVMVLPLPDNLRVPGADRHEIVLRPVGTVALMPRLIRVAPNALPVIQRAKVEQELVRWGNGRSGQTHVVEPAGLLDADDLFEGAVWRLNDLNGAPAVKVELLGDQPWSARNPDEADPNARVYAVEEDSDGRRIAIRFGNGINGARPAANATLRLNLDLSCGAGGVIEAELNWALRNHGLTWRNNAPIRGGADPPDAAAMLDTARARLRDARPLATSAQIEAAARALPAAYGVVRAQVEEGWEPGRRRPASPRTRTLVVARKHLAGVATESPAWTQAIRRRIAPRLALAERLIVVAPCYRRFLVTARIAVAKGLVPGDVATVVRADLIDRLTPGGTRGATWPLGRGVSTITIGGWIRRIRGVVRVIELVTLDETRQPLSEEPIAIGRGALPWLIDAEVRAEPSGERQ